MPNNSRHLVLAGAVLALACWTVPAAAQSADSGRFFVRGYGGVTFAKAANGGDDVQAEVYGGGFGVNLSRHLALIGDAGYISNIATEEGATAVNLVNSLITLVSGIGAEVNLEARTLYVLGGARYTLGGTRIRPFVEGQGGMTRSSFTLKVTSSGGQVVSDVSKIFKDVFGKDSSTSPAIAAGGGADIRITEALSAEAGYHYLRLFGDAKANVHQVFGGVKVSF